MSIVVGFDTVRVGELASRLATAGQQASGVRESIARIVANAEDAAAAGDYDASPSQSEADGGALLTIARGAPPMSSDVKTRLEHLLACQASSLPIDTDLFFNDENPPDPAKVKAAIAFFNQHIDDSGGFLWSDAQQGLQEVLSDWEKLTPTELDAVINSLTPAQFKELNSQLGEGGSWWGAGNSNTNLRIAFANMIYSEVGTDALSRADAYAPALQPESSTQYLSGLQYMLVNGTLYPPGGANVEKDLSQGDDGDCWFLSALGTIVMHDPDFLSQHIHENANGTYTVTFYSNGSPVNVTVDGTLPLTSNNGYAYAHSNSNDGSLWVAIYEKAYAQYRGGYEAINATRSNSRTGAGSYALQDLTGNQTSGGTADEYTLSEVAGMMKTGAVFTTGTKDDTSLWDRLFGGGPDTEDNSQLVTSHEYMIKSVNLNADPPTITVVNPWGSGGVEDNHVMPQEVTLTQQQWQEYFDEVAAVWPKANDSFLSHDALGSQ
ncbi:MAG: C2 family cysteine protease [Streptosporangiaceae bacterium]|jgi:hypothetical protein